MTALSLVRDALVDARAHIDTPEKWCQGKFVSRSGQCCATEALMRVTPSGADPDEITYKRAMKLLERAAGQPLILYNDMHSHDEVVAVYDQAIAWAS